MSTRGKYRLALTLLLIGGVLSLGWGVASLLSLFDLAESDTMPLKAFDAFGPLGIILVILGGILSRWDLRALRRQADEEEPSRKNDSGTTFRARRRSRAGRMTPGQLSEPRYADGWPWASRSRLGGRRPPKREQPPPPTSAVRAASGIELLR